jgi:hypothetical protein
MTLIKFFNKRPNVSAASWSVKIVGQFCVLLKEYTREIIVRVLVVVKRKESQTLKVLLSSRI